MLHVLLVQQALAAFSCQSYWLLCALQASVAVRFCPKLFARSRLGEDCKYPGQAELPYKMVFAIATFDTIILYNTEVQIGHPNLANPVCLAESECLKSLQTFTFCRSPVMTCWA